MAVQIYMEPNVPISPFFDEFLCHPSRAANKINFMAGISGFIYSIPQSRSFWCCLLGRSGVVNESLLRTSTNVFLFILQTRRSTLFPINIIIKYSNNTRLNVNNRIIFIYLFSVIKPGKTKRGWNGGWKRKRKLNLNTHSPNWIPFVR